MAEAAKDEANTHYKAGSYTEAVKSFTRAIESSSSEDKDFLKKCYSNRSATYHQLKRYESALQDSIKITDELDPQWAKGWSRKGDAFFSLRKYTEAYNAYNRAVTLEAGNTAYKTQAEKAMNAIAADAERTNRQYFQAQTQNNYTPPGTLGTVKTVLTQVSFLLFFLAFLPLQYIPGVSSFVPSSSILYKSFIGTSIIGTLVVLYAQFGMPQFNMTYVGRLLHSNQGNQFMIALLCIANRPYFLASLPLILLEIPNYSTQLVQVALPAIATLKGMSGMMSPQTAPAVEQIERILNSGNAPQLLRTEMNKLSINCEIFQGLYLIVELLMPTRSFIFIYVWWNYLLMRHMMDQSGAVKSAFIQLDTRITTLLSHNLCPKLIMTGYGYIRTFIISQVEAKMAETQGQQGADGSASGGGGMMGGLAGLAKSCTIS